MIRAVVALALLAVPSGSAKACPWASGCRPPCPAAFGRYGPPTIYYTSDPVPVARQVSPSPAPVARYFPVRMGDRLEYEEVIAGFLRVPSHWEEVTAVGSAGEVVLVTTRLKAAHQEGCGTFTYRVADSGVEITAGPHGPYDRPFRLLRLPAKKGDGWANAGAEDDAFAGKWIVAGEEDVEVTAGKFRAVRVEWTSQFKGQPIRGILWLAPGRGTVREQIRIGKDETVRELKAFTPGKK